MRLEETRKTFIYMFYGRKKFIHPTQTFKVLRFLSVVHRNGARSEDL